MYFWSFCPYRQISKKCHSEKARRPSKFFRVESLNMMVKGCQMKFFRKTEKRSWFLINLHISLPPKNTSKWGCVFSTFEKSLSQKKFENFRNFFLSLKVINRVLELFRSAFRMFLARFPRKLWPFYQKSWKSQKVVFLGVSIFQKQHAQKSGRYGLGLNSPQMRFIS